MRNIALLMLVIFVLALTGASPVQAEDGVDVIQENTLSKNADRPEKVYARYCRAVHTGDLNTIKKLVYSRALILWNRNGRKMMAITKNSIPPIPRMISRKDRKEYQYNYTEMTMTGKMPKGQPVRGTVTMIVEKGQWKVYEEKWRQGI